MLRRTRSPGRDLADTRVVVTGAASGIGEAIAREVSSRGARLTLVDADAVGVRRVAESLPDADAHQADIRDAAALDAIATELASHGEVPRLVFANAGVCAIGNVLELPLDDARWVLEVNTLGALLTARAFTPAMVEAGAGALVFTASLAGHLPVPGLSVYCASKHAVVGLADSLRLELARSGVTVTTLCPGYVPTGLHDNTRYSHAALEGFMDRTTERGGGVSAPDVARRTVDGALRGEHTILLGAERAAVWIRRLSPFGYHHTASVLGRVLKLL